MSVSHLALLRRPETFQAYGTHAVSVREASVLFIFWVIYTGSVDFTLSDIVAMAQCDS